MTVDSRKRRARPAFYEFFAGGGMARAGLGRRWRCAFANDICPKKSATYRDNWGEDDFVEGDIAALKARDLPGRADLVWASFPCQDLSLAGARAGFAGERSSLFWSFWSLMKELRAQGRAPRLIAIENVVGLASSHGGRDFRAIVQALARAGYFVGARIIDGAHFTPQSRPRIFIVASASPPPGHLLIDEDAFQRVEPQLARTIAHWDGQAARRWVRWRVAPPPPRSIALADVIEPAPNDAPWDTVSQTTRLIEMMSPLQRGKLDEIRKSGTPAIGALYRRTRTENGEKRQRAEARFDGMVGCLRTPAGGSSRQRLIFVDGESVRTRLLSSREAARLMGLPDSFVLPARLSDALRLAGDGVVAPVIAHLRDCLFEPLLNAQSELADAA